MKKVVLIVLDSVGIGAMPDAAEYGDQHPNTVGSILQGRPDLEYPNLAALGMGEIVPDFHPKKSAILTGAYYGKMAERSHGKDTTTGHWEMSGIITEKPLAIYPNGFPDDMLKPFLEAIGSDILGNEAASGTEIIQRLGEEHIRTGKPIVYTSADSVFQIAAHEDIIPLDRLYEICRIARELYADYPYLVGRIIARPFVGEIGNFTRDNPNRRDFSITPPSPNLLTILNDHGKQVFSVGKIEDIFPHSGIQKGIHTKDNMDGVDQTLSFYQQLEHGLLFVNLVDFDSKFGHRRNISGYAQALKDFDNRLPEILSALDNETLLILTADHGCDPGAPGSDHTREYVPLLVYQKSLTSHGLLETRASFSDLSASILEYLGVSASSKGSSFIGELK